MIQLGIGKKLRKACTKAKYTTIKVLTRENTNLGKLITQVITPAIAAVAVVGIGVPAHAYQIYTGGEKGPGDNNYPRLPSTPNADAARDNFLNNLNSYGTETFEELANGTTQPTLSFPGVGSAIFDIGTVRNLPVGTSQTIPGAYPISGDQYIEGYSYIDTSVPSSPNFVFSSINFSRPVAALGFYATSISDYFSNTPVALELTRTNGTTQILPIHSVGSPFDVTVQYYGVIAQDSSEEFTKVRFSPQTSRGDAFGLDDITAAKLEQIKSSKPVPEPLTILGSLAAGGVGVALRRKFKQQKDSVLE